MTRAGARITRVFRLGRSRRAEHQKCFHMIAYKEGNCQLESEPKTFPASSCFFVFFFNEALKSEREVCYNLSMFGKNPK